MADEPITEEWRVVEDWSDYEVSNFGRVRRRVDRYWCNPKDGSLSVRWASGTLLSPFPDPDGYLIVNLVECGKAKRRRVSMLVCRAFNGDAPTPRHHAAHEDGDKSRNFPGNLSWKTAKENNADKVRHGTIARGERSGTAILTESQIIMIRTIPARSGYPARQIANDFGVAKSTIDRIRQRKTWKHVE